MAICADGHLSTAEDYCDTCGLPIGSAAAQSVSPPPPRICPACGTPVAGRFCEACGRDTALPEPQPAAAAAAAVTERWTAAVAADRGFYDRVLARGGPDAVEFPEFFP